MSIVYCYNNNSTTWNSGLLFNTGTALTWNYTVNNGFQLIDLWSGSVPNGDYAYNSLHKTISPGSKYTSSDVYYFRGTWKSLSDTIKNYITNTCNFHYFGSVNDNNIVSGSTVYIPALLANLSSSACDLRIFNDDTSESTLNKSFNVNISSVLTACCKLTITNKSTENMIMGMSETNMSGSINKTINSSDTLSTWYIPTFRNTTITIKYASSNNYRKKITFSYNNNIFLSTILDCATGSITLNPYSKSVPRGANIIVVIEDYVTYEFYSSVGSSIFDFTDNDKTKWIIDTNTNLHKTDVQKNISNNTYYTDYNIIPSLDDWNSFAGYFSDLTEETKNNIINNNFHFNMSENDDYISKNDRHFEINGILTETNNNNYYFSILNSDYIESNLKTNRFESSADTDKSRYLRKCSKLILKTLTNSTNNINLQIKYAYTETGDKTFIKNINSNSSKSIWMATYVPTKEWFIKNNNSTSRVFYAVAGENNKYYYSNLIPENWLWRIEYTWSPYENLNINPGQSFSVVTNLEKETLIAPYSIVENKNPFDIISLNGITTIRYKKNSTEYNTISINENGFNYNNQWIPPYNFMQQYFAYDNTVGISVMHKTNMNTANSTWIYVRDTLKCGKPFSKYGSNFEYSYISIPVCYSRVDNYNSKLFYFYNYNSSSPSKIPQYDPNNANDKIVVNNINYYACIPCWKLINSCASEITVSAYGFTVPNENELNATGYRMPVGYATTVIIINNSNKIQKIYKNGNELFIIYPNESKTYSISSTETTINTSYTFTSSEVQNTYVRVNGFWEKAIAMIKINGSWKTCQPYVWKDGAWHKTS